MLTLKAYAKLNLTLEVLGQRSDGYHEVASVMQTVSLADILTFRPAAELTLTCSDRRLETKKNSVLRAARLLDPQGTRGAAIDVQKAIPVAAGLGGGSADAAATLWALNVLWGLGLRRERLLDLAAGLGADVPFFLDGGTAVATGRGEVLTPLPPAKERWFLVVSPEHAVLDKTRTMYGLVQERHWTRGRVTEQLAYRIRAGRPVREAYLWNAFDAVAPEVFPDFREWRRRLLEVIANRPHLAGSGPSLFIPVEDGQQGEAVVKALGDRDRPPAVLSVVHTVGSAREVL